MRAETGGLGKVKGMGGRKNKTRRVLGRAVPCRVGSCRVDRSSERARARARACLDRILQHHGHWNELPEDLASTFQWSRCSPKSMGASRQPLKLAG